MAYSANPNLFVESLSGGLRAGSALTDLLRRKRDDRELSRLAQLAKQGDYEGAGAGLFGLGEVNAGVQTMNIPYNRQQQALEMDFRNRTLADSNAWRERNFLSEENYRKATLGLAKTKAEQDAVDAEQKRLAAESEASAPNFDDERALSKEFQSQTKDYPTIRDSYSKIKATTSDTSAAGDLALIFSFMKILDPGSVVKETEFANAQNAAGVPDQIRNAWNRAKSGERLNPEQRADFLKQAKSIYDSMEKSYKGTKSKYEKIAKAYGFEPSRVFADAIMEDGEFDPTRLIPAPPPPGSPAGVDDALVNDLINRYGGR